MTTQQTIEKYFDGINKGNWEPLISEDMIFTSPSGASQKGKDPYVTATKRFLQVVKSVQVPFFLIQVHLGILWLKDKNESKNSMELQHSIFSL